MLRIADRYWRLGRICGAAVLMALLAGCGGSSSDGERATAAGDNAPSAESGALPAQDEATLFDLESLGELQAAVNEDEGVPRLILLLSPT